MSIRNSVLFVAAVLAALLSPVSARAQPATDSVVIAVSVNSSDEPIRDAAVTVRGETWETDRNGVAVLRLLPGRHRLNISAEGYRPASLDLVAERDTSVTIRLTETDAAEDEHDDVELETVVVTATRSEQRIEDVPVRVEVLAREEVEEKMMMTPGDVSMMLNETSGLRVQTTSPSLGGANVRVQGLRGRYTQVLSDGLPLYGGQSGSLGLLQIPPMDLGQVEVIKGAASALYGASALGGVVNLVSRRPADDRELLLNATTLGGGDAVFWSSGALGGRWGYTFLGGAHGQRSADLDGDSWSDLPS